MSFSRTWKPSHWDVIIKEDAPICQSQWEGRSLTLLQVVKLSSVWIYEEVYLFSGQCPWANIGGLHISLLQLLKKFSCLSFQWSWVQSLYPHATALNKVFLNCLTLVQFLLWHSSLLSLSAQSLRPKGLKCHWKLSVLRHYRNLSDAGDEWLKG